MYEGIIQNSKLHNVVTAYNLEEQSQRCTLSEQATGSPDILRRLQKSNAAESMHFMHADGSNATNSCIQDLNGPS